MIVWEYAGTTTVARSYLQYIGTIEEYKILHDLFSIRLNGTTLNFEPRLVVANRPFLIVHETYFTRQRVARKDKSHLNQ